MLSVSRSVALGLLLTVMLPGTSSAAQVKILELNYVFAPDPVTVALGDTVTWKDEVRNRHNTTDQSPLVLWDSGLMRAQETFSYTVTAASTYPYFCQLHERFGMFGVLKVQDVATPPGGPVGTVFTITVGTVDAPPGMVYDIQKRDPQGVFLDWMTGTTAQVTFDSTGQPPGGYRFRSRLRRISDDATTQFSPPLAVQVTP